MNTITAMKSFKFRAYAGSKDHDKLDQILINHCELYNAALENRKTAYITHKESITKYDQFKEWTLVRQDDIRWSVEDLRLARGTISRVDKAFASFYRRVKQGINPGYPRFKSKTRFETLELAYNKGTIKFNTKGDKLITKIKGIPRLEIPIKNREIPDLDNIKSLTITKKLNRIDIVLTAKVELKPIIKTGAILGVDLGVNKRATTSDGDIIPRIDTSDTKKKKLQRRVSRAKKGSNNRKKKIKAYGKECNKVAESNKQTTHRLTSDLIKIYDLIVLEKLNIKGMTAAGRSYKKGLNREILANRWGMLRNQLTYKAEWAGKDIVLVNPKYTSQTCSNCGMKDKQSRQGERFKCKSCGFEIDADLNAAINILRRGQEISGRVGIEPVRTAKCSTNPVLTGCT